MTERTKTKVPGIYKKSGRYVILATKRTGPDGVRRRIEKTLPEGTTFEEARKARAELQRELEEVEKNRKAKNESKLSETTTVVDYAERWIATKALRLKESVKHHYLAVLSMRILPYLGELAVRDVTRHDLEAWVGRMERAERSHGVSYSRHTVHAWFRVMMTLIKDAAADLGLPDPTVRLRPPKTDVDGVRESRTLTIAELGRLLDVAKTHVPDWYPEIATLAYTGMRPGELYALTWGCIRFDTKEIVIKASVWKGFVASTKTGVTRKSAFASELVPILEDHRSSREALGEPVGPDDLVFPSVEGSPRATSALFKVLGIVGEIAGIEQKVGPQVLRRTLNTLLVEAGVSAVVVRAQMGHATARMTDRYAGVHQAVKVAAVNQLVSSTKEGLAP